MSAPRSTRESLIAPCGIDCGFCRAHVRAKNPCPGCRIEDASKPKTRVTCKIKTCEELNCADHAFCFSCNRFPCAPLAHLDDRYRAKYGLSPVENLVNIKHLGIRRFVKEENKRWLCRACGETLCMHEPKCSSCGRLRPEWPGNISNP